VPLRLWGSRRAQPPSAAGVGISDRFETISCERTHQLFGVGKPLEASSTEDIGGVFAEADPRKLVTLAGGLRVDVLSAQANLGPNVDMMVLWPNDSNPTHLILCNEEGEAEPGVRRVRLATGAVETVMSGLDSCDPVRRTEWATILVGEETDDGWVLEIIKPLDTMGVTFNRATAMDNMAYQPGRGNWIIHEDGDGPDVGRNNDLWSCLDDGDDDGYLSDGCVRIGTLNAI